MYTTRLLLPFTGGINEMALSYALQIAEQRRATLVLLALIEVKPNKGARLEHIQEAQDFLVLARCKARRLGIPIESASVYTGNVALSIEAVTGEMNCDSVILFLGMKDEALLKHEEVRELMDRAVYNMHIVLLPTRRKQRLALHIPLLRRSSKEVARTKSGALRDEPVEKYTPLVHHLMPDEDSR